jgi:hypothetical protein
MSRRPCRRVKNPSNAPMFQVNPKHWKPFGCPVYVLDSKIQGGSGIFHKWKSRANLGIYLGRSPQHTRSVALVLDRRTALVSPQFHVSFDPSFHTVKQDTFDSQWQLKAGFVGQREPKRPAQPVTGKQQEVKWTSPPSLKRKRSEDLDRIQDMDTTTMLQHDTSQQQTSPGNEPTKPQEKEQEPVERLIEAMMMEIK